MGYLHIDNLYKNQEILMFKECYALEKIHGCVDGKMQIQTKFGYMTISDIVKQKYSGKILVYDVKNKRRIWKKIKQFFINGKTNHWLKITLENGDELKVTPNHYIFLPELGCYRLANELKVGDFLLTV